MSHEAIREKVKAVLRGGIEVEIYRAEEGVFLFQEISNHLDKIKQDNFDNLFGVIQQQCIATLVLSLTKMFEEPGRHEVRSLPWLIDYLEKDVEAREAYPEVDAFEGLLADWRAMIEEAKRENAKTLEKLKKVRNKRVAHSELIPDDEISGPTWAEVDELIRHAQDILSAMGRPLMNMSYKFADGTYLLTGDAGSASRALGRLFAKAYDED